jgi:site-specific recombinase XerD
MTSWLKVYNRADHINLFVTKFSTPMSKRAIQYTVSKHLQAANIKGASVHTLRHTMATHHIARGTDLKTIQETLGHADLATTSIYVSLAKKTQRKALQEHAL